MPKVTIKGLATHKMAKDHKKAAPQNKPAGKPKVAAPRIAKPRGK